MQAARVPLALRVKGVSHASMRSERVAAVGHARRMDRSRTQLPLAAAIGRGSTELAAFDAALVAAGVANFNLIRLSSVIPANCEVIESGTHHLSTEACWGDRLYAVWAERRTSVAGEQAWAGVGWRQDPVDGRGLFVEHEGSSESSVRAAIASSLDDLQSARDLELGAIRMSVVGAKCSGAPTCALVICVFGTEPWPFAGGSV